LDLGISDLHIPLRLQVQFREYNKPISNHAASLSRPFRPLGSIFLRVQACTRVVGRYPLQTDP
jgi:hypothetical protein